MSIKGIICDIGGVLYESNTPIPGAVETISTLRKKYKLRFATNTTRRAPCTIMSRLKKMGFELSEKELFTALAAAKKLVEKSNGKCYTLLTQDATDYFGSLHSDNENIHSVVVGDAAENFNYSHMNRAFRFIYNGATIIAAAKNRYFKDSDGELSLDAGPFVAALEFATGKKAKIVGKPSADFFALALESMDCKPEEAVMIGDDIENDIGGAQEMGMKAVLVKTGKFHPSDLDKPIWPDAVIPSIAELPETLEKL